MKISIRFIRFLQIIVAALIPVAISLFENKWILIISSAVLLGLATFLLERGVSKKKASGERDVSKIITISLIAFALFSLALAAWKIHLFG